MNVLHMTTHLQMGGISIYILRLAKFLKPHGVQTHVFSSGGALTAQLEEEGARVYERPVRTKNMLHPKLYLQLPYLVRLVRTQKIDLIHAHTRVMQTLAACLSRLTGVPVITTCHGFYHPKLGRLLFPAWGHCAIAISHLVQDHLEKDLHVPKDRIRMIHNGVDAEGLKREYQRFQTGEIKKKLGFSEKDPVVGIIARLVKDKGHEYVLRAVKLLEKEYPSLKLIIAGDGPNRAALESLTAELELEEKVRFTGTVTDIAEFLSAMDLFTLPATWREGFGLSIIEAMACGKPVIVTNIWALSVLVQHEITGLLVEPKDEKALAAAIHRLLTEPEFARRLAENGRQTALKLFTMDRMAHEIYAVYKKAALPAAP